MIVSSKKDLSKSVLNINGVELTMESSVKLLDVEIDNKLNLKVGNKNKNKLKSAKRFRNNHRQCSTDKS